MVHAADPGDGRPGHLRAVGRPAPRAAHGEVVVAVHAALLRPGVAAPAQDGTVVGDHGAGVVHEVGPGVAGLAVGDAVALPALLTCGSCPACRAGRSNLCPTRRRPGVDVDGWAAERVVVRADLVVSTAATVPAPLAASVPGVVAEAAHALRRAGAGPGLTVAVVGADAFGLHLTQLAALAGSEVITLDDRDAARERAADLGADETGPRGTGPLVDVLAGPVDRILVTGTPDATVLRALAPGGRLVVCGAEPGGGVEVPTDALVDGELDVVGATGATHAGAVEMLDLAAESRLVLHTAIGPRFGADELAAAETAIAADDGLLVVIDPR